jgi:hypothetical protein
MIVKRCIILRASINIVIREELQEKCLLRFKLIMYGEYGIRMKRLLMQVLSKRKII